MLISDSIRCQGRTGAFITSSTHQRDRLQQRMFGAAQQDLSWCIVVELFSLVDIRLTVKNRECLLSYWQGSFSVCKCSACDPSRGSKSLFPCIIPSDPSSVLDSCPLRTRTKTHPLPPPLRPYGQADGPPALPLRASAPPLL